MDSAACCSFQLSNRQTLSSVPPQLSSFSTSISPVTYTFNLTTVSVALLTSDALVIEWPPVYSSQISSSNSAAVCAGVSLNVAVNPGNIKPPSCSVSLNKIRLTNFLVGNGNSSETFIVSVSGRTNPSSTPTSGFNLATVSSSGFVLEEIRGQTISLTANTLSSFTVTANSSITNNPYTLYTFAVGNNAPLSNGYTIRIDFPADYYFIDYGVMACTVAGSTMPCGRTNSTYATAAQSVLINVNSTVATVGSVSVSGVTNPKVQANTAGFSAFILDVSGSTVESSRNSPTFAVTGTGPFGSMAVTAYDLSSSGSTR